MHRNTTFASAAEYRCSDGFELIGNSTRTCQASGDWSGEEPTCGTNAEVNGGNTPQSDSMIPVVAGVVAGVIVAALLTTLIFVIIIFIMKRRKRGNADMKPDRNKIDDLDNPVYSGMLVFMSVLVVVLYVTMSSE